MTNSSDDKESNDIYVDGIDDAVSRTEQLYQKLFYEKWKNEFK